MSAQNNRFFADLDEEPIALKRNQKSPSRKIDFFSDLDESQHAPESKANKFFADLEPPAPQIDTLVQEQKNPGFLDRLQEEPTARNGVATRFLTPSSSIEEPMPLGSEETKEPSLFQRAKDYFTSGKLGEAAAYQMRSGGSSGAPSLTPEQAKKVALEAGTQIAVGEAFAPLHILARASKYAPYALEALTRLTQAGTTGAAIPAVESLVETGELPTKEELLKDGLTWVAIDATLQALHLGGQFAGAVNNIAKAEGIPRREVLGRLWDATKNYFKQKISPEAIRPDHVETLFEKAIEAEERGLPETTIESKLGTAAPEPPESTIVVEPESKLEIAPESRQIEPEPIAAAAEEKPPASTSGYQRKPEPKTVPEKIGHLAQKIKESEAYADALNAKLTSARDRLKEMKAQKEPLRDIQQVRENVEQLMDARDAERSYAKQLKTDLRDFKAKGEESRVQVPLGRGALEKRVRLRPHEKELAEKRPVMGQKQAVARSKIMGLFRKAFTDPIRLGKFKQRASGIHKLWPKVTRLLKDNDVETVAHEIGHNLHTTLYGGDAATPREQAANIHKALRPYLDELKPLALYEPFGMEGFAEFTRLYVTNPDTALKLAPNFYAKFEADLEAQYPEMKNALLDARDYYDQYLQGTPESRIRAQTNYAEDATKLDNLVDWIKSNLNFDNLKTQFLDDVFPAKRLVAEAFGIPLSEVENLKDPRNLYRSLRVLKGAIGKADVFLTHQTFDAKTLKRKGRGLRQILKKLKTPEEYKEFNDYLIARRVMEKGQQGIETGINFGDAVVTERKLAPQYKKLGVLLDRYNDALLTYARDSGLLSEEQYVAIKKANMMYVPFQRVIEKPAGTAATGGRLQAGRPIKRMKGSTRDIIAPIESIIKNTYAIIVNAEKNLAGQVLAKLAGMKNVGRFVERVPVPTELKAKISREEAMKQMGFLPEEKLPTTEEGTIDLEALKPLQKAAKEFWDKLEKIMPDFFLRFGVGTYPAGENIVTVFVDGKPQYYEVSPELYEMWTKGIAPYTANIITRILRIPARALRAGAILNPKFMMKNFVRDTWGGFLFTKYGKSIKDPAGLFIDTLYAPLAQLMTAATQAGLYVEWMKAGGGMSTMQSLDREAVAKKLKEVRDGFSAAHPIKWLRKVSEISEESNRLAEFGRALEVEGLTRLGKEIAAFASRDLSIDFAKIGLQTKALNQIIPFWNATVQGGDKLFRALGSDQDRAEFIARAIGFILIPSLILAWLNKDDERVKEFYEEEKDFNFITFVGDTAIKIPVPFETGVLVHGLTQRLFNFAMKKDPHAFEGFFGSVMSAMLPNFLPAMVNPFVEVQANKNFFTGAPIIPKAKEGLVAKYQYKNGTSATARLLGRATAYMLGQDTRSKAASPAVIDHFINSWGAGLGRLVVSLADAGLEAAGLSDKIPGPEQSIIDRFELNAFAARYPRASTRSVEKFYDYYSDATARHRSIKHAEKIDLEEPEEIQKAYERVNAIYDYPTLKRAYKAMQMSQRAINEIWQNPDLDPEMKRTMIDELYLQQIQFAKAAVGDIEKYRLSRKKGS